MNDFENGFKSLKGIGRSELAKEKTLKKLQVSTNRKKWNYMPTVVSGLLIVVAAFFIFVNLPKEELVGAHPKFEAGGSFKTSLLSLSKSTHSFYPERTLPPGTVEVNNDVNWNKYLKEILKTMTETNELPIGKPLYDLGLYGGKDFHRFKVWSDANMLILKDLDTGLYYRATSEEAVIIVTGMMGNLMGEI